jgi:hypothetical protein
VDDIHYGGGLRIMFIYNVGTNVNYVGKVNKVKINNFKIIQDLGVIGDEEFKTQGKEMLDL